MYSYAGIDCAFLLKILYLVQCKCSFCFHRLVLGVIIFCAIIWATVSAVSVWWFLLYYCYIVMIVVCLYTLCQIKMN